MSRQYDMLGRKLLGVLREGGARKFAILKGLAAHWGYSETAFQETVERLRASGQLVERRRQGGLHLGAR